MDEIKNNANNEADELKEVDEVKDSGTDAPAVDTDVKDIPVDTPEEIIELVLNDTDEADEDKADDAAAASEDEYFELSGLTEAQRKRRIIFDKVTTGILIALLASPIAILSYIILWFVFR